MINPRIYEAELNDRIAAGDPVCSNLPARMFEGHNKVSRPVVRVSPHLPECDIPPVSGNTVISTRFLSRVTAIAKASVEAERDAEVKRAEEIADVALLDPSGVRVRHWDKCEIPWNDTESAKAEVARRSTESVALVAQVLDLFGGDVVDSKGAPYDPRFENTSRFAPDDDSSRQVVLSREDALAALFG